MKFLFLVIFFIVTFNFYSQTKIETQEWIEEKIELNAYNNGIDIAHDFDIEYEGEYLIIRKTLKRISSFGINEDKNIYKIPIKELNKVRFIQFQTSVHLIISIKNFSNTIQVYNITTKTQKNTNEIELVLSKSLNEDDLKNRITKAFNHLIILYGGIVVEEKF